jgi:hypothetical protein
MRLEGFVEAESGNAVIQLSGFYNPRSGNAVIQLSGFYNPRTLLPGIGFSESALIMIAAECIWRPNFRTGNYISQHRAASDGCK